MPTRPGTEQRATAETARTGSDPSRRRPAKAGRTGAPSRGAEATQDERRKAAWVCVEGLDGTPLGMAHPALARMWRKKRKTRMRRIAPMVVRLRCPHAEACFLRHRGTGHDVRIGIDPGAKTSGLAVTIDGVVVWSAHIHHRSNVIRHRLQKRKEARSNRRCRRKRKADRPRKPARWRHRKRPEGWLPPSVEHRVRSLMRWVDTLAAYAGAGASHLTIVVEVCAFDAHKVLRPDVEGSDYQRGPLWRTNLRGLVMERDAERCVYCGAKNPSTIDHVIPVSRGGPHGAWNRAAACAPCNHDKGNQPLEQWLESAEPATPRRGAPEGNDKKRRAAVRRRAKQTLKKIHALAEGKTGLAPMAAANVVAPVLARRLADRGIDVERVSGADTAAWRQHHGLEKTHAHDATCAALQHRTPRHGCTQPLNIKMTGRGRRLIIQRGPSGFPRLRKDGTIVDGYRKMPAIRTGDTVRIAGPGRRRRIALVTSARHDERCDTRDWEGRTRTVKADELTVVHRATGDQTGNPPRKPRKPRKPPRTRTPMGPSSQCAADASQPQRGA